MSGFSASWLSLREAADHRSRHTGLARRLSGHFIDQSTVRVTDIGSGTGSNLRATAPLLGASQEWTLVDHDSALLEEAARALSSWADEARAIGDALVLVKAGRNIGVSFRVADLDHELDDVLARAGDLVTASALFDLISESWMKRFAAALATSGAAFYTVLTYDGRDAFTPEHPADHAVIAAFAAHQRRDKGFGPAAGPDAARALDAALKDAGFAVETGSSPWVLTETDFALASELLPGIAGAAGETGAVDETRLSDWLAFRLAEARKPGAEIITGHTDILAWKA